MWAQRGDRASRLGLRFRTGRLNAYANYAFTDATFQTALTLNSENNPSPTRAGNIQVRPGNRLPGVPRNLFKVGADYGITDNWVAWIFGPRRKRQIPGR